MFGLQHYQFIKPLGFLFLSLCIASGCSIGQSYPTEKEASKIVTNSALWSSKIERQKFKLIEFGQSSGKQKQIGEHNLYNLYFDAEIEFIEPFLGNKECKQTDKSTDCTGNTVGATKMLTGYVTFEKSSIGWEPAGLVFD